MPAANKSKLRQDCDGFIDPRRMYTVPGFMHHSGITRKHLTEARRKGIYPKMLQVGVRRFIRGEDAIAFIEAYGREVQ